MKLWAMPCGAIFSKSLINFSSGQGYVPSLLFDLGPNYGGGNEDNGDLLQKVPCTHCCTQCPWPCSRPPPTHASPETPGHAWASLGDSLLGSLLTSHGSQWAKCLFVPSKRLFPQSCVSSGGSMVGLMATSSKRAYAIPRYTEIPQKQIQRAFISTWISEACQFNWLWQLPECVITSWTEWGAQMTVNSTGRQKSVCFSNWRTVKNITLIRMSIECTKKFLCGNASQSIYMSINIPVYNS